MQISFDPPRCYALIPCAGVGSRSGAAGPKQYEAVAGQSLVSHTLAAFQAVTELAGTLVVLSPGDTRFEQHAQHPASWVARVGGASRAETVRAGLDALQALGAQPHDWVLVHDAARCLIRPEWIRQLLAQCHDDEVGGLLAVPLPDTLKASVPGQACVAATLPRQDKWLAQTPQMFRWGLLRLALQDLDEQITDEASAVERLGHQPRLVPCSIENFKVTYPQDFLLAERLLATR